ncbi:MAG: glycerol kinase GlpK [Methanosarcinaceae archaeon]|nr:glycerol kinase GlpK [Methanosarcinaceae archaeon]
MNSRGLFLAIDQSTSATKAMLFTLDGMLLDQESLSHVQIYPSAGWVEHDAEKIFNNTLDTTSALLQRHTDQWSNLLAVSITNQRETFVLFDRETGKPLYNAIVWQCRRGDDLCKKLELAGKETIVHELTGLKIDTYFPASKLRWLLDARPDLRAKLKDGSALFGTIDTYLIYRLSGGKVYATDYTNASRTLFFDIEKLGWSEDLCKIFGLEFGKLPDIRESSAWFGDTDLGGCLKRRIPICGIMGDSQAALFAQRCFAPGGAKVTFGTGSSVLLNIGHQKRLSAYGTLTALAWVFEGQPTYAYEGIINFTGATITWLRDQLKLIDNQDETEALARSISNSDGVFLVPAFVGLSAPYWRADARAAILGMTPSTTRAHIVRAALESIGYIVTDVLKAMGEEAGVQINMIHADGGAVRNAFLMQFVADLNQLDVRAARTPELSALGAVFSGCLGLKIYSSLNDLKNILSGFTEYRPSMSSAGANELFADWKSAVQQVLYQPKQG